MKKLLVAALIMVLSWGAVNAQNNFRGIVKYKLTSTGTVDVQIPEEQSTIEVKVFDNKLMTGQTQQNGMKVAQAIDLSQAIGYLAANGIERRQIARSWRIHQGRDGQPLSGRQRTRSLLL